MLSPVSQIYGPISPANKTQITNWAPLKMLR